MIEQLYIENVVLIKKTFVSFGDSLNIISGESGAGKSILLRCISFVFGGRVTKDFIRRGEKKAEVRCTISIENDIMKSKIESLGIDIDEDRTLLITRTYNDKGKNVCYVNYKLVNLRFLKELSKVFIDIHSQHQHQYLLEKSRHIELLDFFCGEELELLKEKLVDEYSRYKDLKNKYNRITNNSREKEIKIDILNYQINEIESLQLEEGEEYILENRQKKMSNLEKIEHNIRKSIYSLSGDTSNAIDCLNKCSNYLQNLSDVDDECEGFNNDIINILELTSDLNYKLRRYIDTVDYTPNELEEIEDRLNQIYKLKKKYGNSTKEILDFLDKSKVELCEISIDSDSLDNIEKDIKESEKKCFDICKSITTLRKEKSSSIEEGIESNLHDLGMEDIKFKINISKKSSITENGIDDVAFYMSTNKGEELKELDKIASGGEMSRIMLALKNVLANKDTVEVFIFDEIDTGVSGVTAQKVANKLKELSKTKQIITITHLPQIASAGDTHIYVKKSVIEDNTYSEAVILDSEDVINEVARLFGGEIITKKSKEVAEDLIKLNR